MKHIACLWCTKIYSCVKWWLAWLFVGHW